MKILAMQSFCDFRNLSGRMLVASPTTTRDSYFFKSVIYITDHDRYGVVGLQVNRPVPPELNLDFQPQYTTLERTQSLHEIKMYYGGPVELDRGIILHAGREKNKKSTSSNILLQDPLKHQIKQSTPKTTNKMLLLGHCSWGTEQLEHEIKNNLWIVVDASKSLIFASDSASKWCKALAKCNVTPWTYGIKAGHC